MRNRTIVALLVASILTSAVTSAGVGYLIGLSNQPSLGRCTPTGTVQGSIPAGAGVEVSYQGNWRLSVVEFGSNQTTASALDYVCYYEGSGTTSFYVSYANYQGWNTILALAHKWGTAGNLTLTVLGAGPSSSTNSTASPYGDASTSLSILR